MGVFSEDREHGEEWEWFLWSEREVVVGRRAEERILWRGVHEDPNEVPVIETKRWSQKFMPLCWKG